MELLLGGDDDLWLLRSSLGQRELRWAHAQVVGPAGFLLRELLAVRDESLAVLELALDGRERSERPVVDDELVLDDGISGVVAALPQHVHHHLLVVLRLTEERIARRLRLGRGLRLHHRPRQRTAQRQASFTSGRRLYLVS